MCTTCDTGLIPSRSIETCPFVFFRSNRKMLFKLETARKAGMGDVITFDFSYFASLNSTYPQAGQL